MQIQENSGKFDAGLTAENPVETAEKPGERRKNPESHFGWLLACYFARALGHFLLRARFLEPASNCSEHAAPA